MASKYFFPMILWRQFLRIILILFFNLNSLNYLNQQLFIMKIVFVFFIICLSIDLAAQGKQVFVLNPGQRISDVLTFSDIFHYPEFKTGIVYYRDGRAGSSKLNYNLLTGEVLFIQSTGDTVALADEPTIKLITIDSDQFIYNVSAKLYFQITDTTKKISLLKRESIKFSDSKKIGLFGQPIIAAADQITSLSSHGQVYNITANEKVDLIKQPEYFFENENGKTYPAIKKNIMKVFEKYKDAVQTFLQSQEIDFNKETDLKKLFTYIRTIN